MPTFSEMNKGREIALKILYAVDLGNSDSSEQFTHYQATFMEDADKNSSKAFSCARVIIEGVTANSESIDKVLEQVSTRWRVVRMDPIDRNILRIGTYELLFSAQKISPRGSISQANELAKKFGDTSSRAFVNGVLYQIFEQHTPSK